MGSLAYRPTASNGLMFVLNVCGDTDSNSSRANCMAGLNPPTEYQFFIWNLFDCTMML